MRAFSFFFLASLSFGRQSGGVHVNEGSVCGFMLAALFVWTATGNVSFSFIFLWEI